jgi:hypothetical protein
VVNFTGRPDQLVDAVCAAPVLCMIRRHASRCGDATRWRPWSLRTTCGPDASLGCRDLVSALVAPLLEYLPSLGAAPAAAASAPWTTVDMLLAEFAAQSPSSWSVTAVSGTPEQPRRR